MHPGARRVGILLACLLVTTAVLSGSTSSAQGDDGWELTVCADPNNLPYSNDRLEGFENRIAQMLADSLGARLTYAWWPQRRGFIRETLREGLCDVVMGVPDQYPLALTSEPYYRTSYVFVTRSDRALEIASLDDPVLRDLHIGVQMVGDDYTNTPPAHALANRGMAENVVGYSVYGDYTSPAPLAPIMQAVADGDVDVAIVWGPIAGYFAKKMPVELKLHPVTPEIEPPFLPMVFSVSMAVRQGDEALRDQLDRAIEANWEQIQAVLTEYGVPTLPIPGAPGSAGASAPPPKDASATGLRRGQGARALVDRLRSALAKLRRWVAPTAAAGEEGGAEGEELPQKNPYTGDEEAIAEGKALFSKWGCYGCHGTQGGGGMGPSLVDSRWIYGGDDASVFKTIHDGRPNGMPAWGGYLSEEEIWEVVAFIRSLYKGDPGKVVW
ncbi:quinoprotein dehydrogenase-associated putative ABC transporter substrate-binding protein [Limnochorda pilosa]|uniref:Amino acid ABC transporter substrate-binding protein n=1 Tax=Limnochorda pilosa TaxID=1555112 RepID=A0A0K2SJF5_LIMPI|nr:quinoprotein dehydrogenase-associated putative ABC transporter substrate-binding protein [Limnochorda pilosa]BAS26984.1 amino acid ABC transporter substrate-binding protein [Limnochorda pilosa]